MKILNFLLKVTLLRVVLLPAVPIIFSGCSHGNEKIIIISTNDIHSSIDNIPNLATVVERYRSSGDGTVLLVDAGDRWTGNPYVDMAPEPYRPIIDLMNDLGYDVATFGNHEFDNGMELLARRTEQSAFQNILANADFDPSELPNIEPYTVIRAGGLTLVFLGLITTATNGHPAGKDESFGSTKFYDPVETAIKYKSLRDSADVFIALTHTGIDIDTLLAERLPQLDLIIGGHTHTLLSEGGQKVGDVLITQTGSRLRYVGVTEIEYRRNKVRFIHNKLIMLDTIPPSPQFVAKVEQIRSDPYLSTVAGHVESEMDQTQLLNLFSDIMRQGTGTQFSFYNKGSMRLQQLAPGSITIGDIYSAEPFRNSPVTMRMSEPEIRELIMNKFNSEGGESHSMDIYPSGISYRIITDGMGEATDIFFYHDQLSGKDGKYSVSMSDYMDSQYDFSRRGTGLPTGLFITDLAMEYLKNNDPVLPDHTERVEIVQNF